VGDALGIKKRTKTKRWNLYKKNPKIFGKLLLLIHSQLFVENKPFSFKLAKNEFGTI